MKELTFTFNDVTKELFFPKKRIKDKISIVIILLEATRYMLSGLKIDEEDSAGEIRLIIDKMGRLFFISKDKSYSIVFPFALEEHDGHLLLSFQNNMSVNSYLIANTISALNCNPFNDSCVLGFADSIYEMEEENEDLWYFLKELMLYEDGYIRYDHDPIGFATANGNGEPHKHPLNHYDVFYTNKATFKIGLDHANTIEEFIDTMNVRTDCKYFITK